MQQRNVRPRIRKSTSFLSPFAALIFFPFSFSILTARKTWGRCSRRLDFRRRRCPPPNPRQADPLALPLSSTFFVLDGASFVSVTVHSAIDWTRVCRKWRANADEGTGTTSSLFADYYWKRDEEESGKRRGRKSERGSEKNMSIVAVGVTKTN